MLDCFVAPDPRDGGVISDFSYRHREGADAPVAIREKSSERF
jgi:hypothetical protein